MKKVCLLLVSLVCLVGCASTPLPDDLFKQAAGQTLGYEKCALRGLMPPETAAMGQRFIRNTLNQYSYDKLEFKYYMQGIENSLPDITAEACNKLAMYAYTINGGPASRAAPAAAAKDDYQSYFPKTTYCNRIGTQTFCNQY